MLNIKNKFDYLKLFNFIILIFLLLFFSFKNSLYSYLIFIIISNIIYYIFNKKNIFNFFFITVIITSILYIYLYNNIIETFPYNGKDIFPTCDKISTSNEKKFKIISKKKGNKIKNKLAHASMINAVAGGAEKRSDWIKRKWINNGPGAIPGSAAAFHEKNKKEKRQAKKDHKKEKERADKLESLIDQSNWLTKRGDTYCTDVNHNIIRWVDRSRNNLINHIKSI